MKVVQTKNEDFPTTLMTCFSKDRLLIFTNRPATKKDQNGNEKFTGNVDIDIILKNNDIIYLFDN